MSFLFLKRIPDFPLFGFRMFYCQWMRIVRIWICWQVFAYLVRCNLINFRVKIMGKWVMIYPIHISFQRFCKQVITSFTFQVMPKQDKLSVSFHFFVAFLSCFPSYESNSSFTSLWIFTRQKSNGRTFLAFKYALFF